MDEHRLKQQLTKWLDDNIIDQEDSEALNKAKKLINKKSNTWAVLKDQFTEPQWERLVGSVEVGIRIWNYLHPHGGMF